jgi:16S rRNA (guanine527-N7)-methyltransferase
MMDGKLSPRGEFDKALARHAAAFGVELDDEARARLGDYFELVSAWNPRLHLVAPCTPAEFAVRHVLESLLALRFLAEGARVVDVGSGAGFPIIPCLVVRDDLRALLFESSGKKAVFLREALRGVGRSGAARVIAERFESAETPAADYVTCRAIERFSQMFDALVDWAPPDCVLLLFAGPALLEAIQARGLACEAVGVPATERRYLYAVRLPPGLLKE